MKIITDYCFKQSGLYDYIEYINEIIIQTNKYNLSISVDDYSVQFICKNHQYNLCKYFLHYYISDNSEIICFDEDNYINYSRIFSEYIIYSRNYNTNIFNGLMYFPNYHFIYKFINNYIKLLIFSNMQKIYKILLIKNYNIYIKMYFNKINLFINS